MYRRVVVAAAAAPLLLAAALHAPAVMAEPQDVPAAGKHDRNHTRGLVAQMRRAIDVYRDVDVAVSAGYLPQGPCEETEAGAMGVHYVNPDLMQPEPFDVEQPPILLYAPGPDGSLELLGGEFMVPHDPERAAPTLQGEPFDGPMKGHAEGMPWHYDLHIWTHVANPEGVFAPYNPLVTCD